MGVAGEHTAAASISVDSQMFRVLEGWVDEVLAEIARLRDVCKNQEDLICRLKLSMKVKVNLQKRRSSRKRRKVEAANKCCTSGTTPVDSLYAPMMWGGCHWVGLWISLCAWTITILDPNPGLNSMEEVEELMERVACMLPYIAKKVCPPEAVGECLDIPFHVTRMEGLYQNVKSGDCGPVSVKFLEMHATGNPTPTMSGLTDEMVDIFRKHYAMDIYKRGVLRLYLQN
ncbi:hypothetical protein YC2023_094387 [Brassica napus]